MKNLLTRIIKEPLLHFLVLGACIYGAYAWLGEDEEAPDAAVIRVDSNRIAAFITEWERRWNRQPTREEIDTLVQSYVREEVLYRQAVQMGLNLDDPITRRRMAQKLEFLTSDLAQAQEPAEGELETYFAENEADYRAPDRITFCQVFFNPDERKDASVEDAKAALANLQGAGEPDPATLEAGDRSILKNHTVAEDQSEIARRMGGGFAEAVMKLEPGQWHGPVLSGYGVHLVYVFETQKGALPDLAAVQEQVLEDWRDEQREKFNAEFLENLKSRYEIVIDELPAERLLNPPGGAMTKEESTSPEASTS